jgi:hypothetical protein
MRHLEISVCNRCGAVVSNVEQHFQFHLREIPQALEVSEWSKIEREIRNQISAPVGQIEVQERWSVWEQDDPLEAPSD